MSLRRSRQASERSRARGELLLQSPLRAPKRQSIVWTSLSCDLITYRPGSKLHVCEGCMFDARRGKTCAGHHLVWPRLRAAVLPGRARAGQGGPPLLIAPDHDPASRKGRVSVTMIPYQAHLFRSKRSAPRLFSSSTKARFTLFRSPTSTRGYGLRLHVPCRPVAAATRVSGRSR